jgi:hypothetical protein
MMGNNRPGRPRANFPHQRVLVQADENEHAKILSITPRERGVFLAAAAETYQKAITDYLASGPTQGRFEITLELVAKARELRGE